MGHNFRPETWKEFLGQHQIINNLKIYVNAVKQTEKTLDHILISGPSGMGKTSLAYLISKILNVKLYIINGPSLQKPSDLIALITAMKEHQILFIDEVHSVSKEVLEILYPVLEEQKLNIIIGKEFNSKLINLKLPSFTIIIATTELNKLSNPFINRFPIAFHMDEYRLEDLKAIVVKNALKLNIILSNDSAFLIANYARKTPRIIINLLKRIHDYFLAGEISDYSVANIQKVFTKMGLYEFGLHIKDFEYLNKLSEFKILGVENMSQLINLPVSTIITNIEPILISEKLIIRTTKGRQLTNKGVIYLQKNNF